MPEANTEMVEMAPKKPKRKMLSFFARGSMLVTYPGTSYGIHRGGKMSRYVGRECVQVKPDGQPYRPEPHQLMPEELRGKLRASYPATKEPVRVAADSRAAARLVQVTARDGALWPADKETAEACGLKFTPVKWDSGAWVAVTPPEKRKPRIVGGKVVRSEK